MKFHYTNNALKSLSLASSLLFASCYGFGGTFSQSQVCEGKSDVVLASQADARADPDGWFVYSGGLIFCCAGQPMDVTCSEMLVG